MLTFSYMVGGWVGLMVQQDAYVIKKTTKKKTRKQKGKPKKTVENIAIKYSRNKKL